MTNVVLIAVVLTFIFGSGSTKSADVPVTDVKAGSEDTVDSTLESLAREVQALKNDLKELKRINGVHARTCFELMNLDPTLDDGMYYIDPDGLDSGDSPIYVHCSRAGMTSILHDTETKIKVDRCHEPGCYSRPVTYNATMRQIRALIELSPSCQQSIRFDCSGTVFAYGEKQYAWWNDRNGIPRYYWSGSNETVHTCACGIAGNCVEAVVSCNCDASLTAAELFDEGFVTNKEHLPVSALRFGRTLPESASGEHTLGRFSCSGSYKLPNNTTPPTSCTDLWRWGQTVSGLYHVQKPDHSRTNTFTAVYCDMTRLPRETGQETTIGTTDIKSSLIFFDVARITDFATLGPVIFDNVLVNIGNAMNVTTGKFTAPVEGIYEFSFDFSSANTPTFIELYHNDSLVAHAYSERFETAGAQAILALKVDDVVYVRLMQGKLLSDNKRRTHFTGALLQ